MADDERDLTVFQRLRDAKVREQGIKLSEQEVIDLLYRVRPIFDLARADDEAGWSDEDLEMEVALVPLGPEADDGEEDD